ncbi:MAG: CP12 domain-containing protein [Cyanobacteria bacterium P01_A01_bin.84]
MMRAEDIMSREIVVIRGSATIAEAVDLMKGKGQFTLIVDRCHENDTYGTVSATDIVCKAIAYGKDPKQTRVYEVMTKPSVIVHPDWGVEYVARLFAEIGVCRALVIKDQLVGVISIIDILTKSDFIESPQSLMFEETIQKAIEDARAICATYGAGSKVCTVAWNAVEELQAEAAHQKAESMVSAKATFEEYCAANPDAPECRIYYED